MSGLTETKLRSDIISVFRAGLEAVRPENSIPAVLSYENGVLSGTDIEGRNFSFDLKRFRKVIVLGAGKAGASMAVAIEEMLGDRIDRGLVIVKDGYKLPTARIEVREAGHPLPDERTLQATEELLSYLEDIGPDDFVIFLISGGGSSLMELPVEGVNLSDLQELTSELLSCGADIFELNAVRAKLSQVKAGGLLRHAKPASSLALILSDVPGDDIRVIASGPTMEYRGEISGFDVLKRYNLVSKVRPNILEVLKRETPVVYSRSEGEHYNVLVGSNLMACKASAKRAEQLGYETLILTSQFRGEAREVAKAFTSILMECQRSGHPLKPPACIIAGGEVSVTVRGKGLGGRCTEFALASLIELKGRKGITVLAGATDGTDGMTSCAGALCLPSSWKRAQELGLKPAEFLDNNDSYNFFSKLGDLIVTGPTYTNVTDMYIGLVLPYE